MVVLIVVVVVVVVVFKGVGVLKKRDVVDLLRAPNSSGVVSSNLYLREDKL